MCRTGARSSQGQGRLLTNPAWGVRQPGSSFMGEALPKPLPDLGACWDLVCRPPGPLLSPDNLRCSPTVGSEDGPGCGERGVPVAPAHPAQPVSSLCRDSAFGDPGCLRLRPMRSRDRVPGYRECQLHLRAPRAPGLCQSAMPPRRPVCAPGSRAR